MSSDILVGKFRRFLLWVAHFVCIGTLIEMWLEEHFGTPTQLIPFVLCGMGLMVIWAGLLKSNRASVIALRIVMFAILVGSVFGIYEHLQHNLLFEMEIRPGSGPSDVIMYAFRGASPLLAPGILALAAILAMGATYCHPGFQKKEERE